MNDIIDYMISKNRSIAYEKNKIKAGPLEPYYIDDKLYNQLATKKVRSQLSVKHDTTKDTLNPALSVAHTNTYESTS